MPLSWPVIYIVRIFGDASVVADLTSFTLKQIISSIDALQIVVGACIFAEDLQFDHFIRNGILHIVNYLALKVSEFFASSDA